VSDAELLKQFVQGGSEEAFRLLTERHAGAVFSTCLRRLRSQTLAEDAAQAVFIVLARKAGKLHLRESDSLARWLFQTARFACHHAIAEEARRQAREKEAARMRETQNREVDDFWEEAKARIDALVDSLPGVQREALLLHFMYGKTKQQVADDLGCGESTIRMRIESGLKRLRSKLAAAGLRAPDAVLSAALASKVAEALPEGLCDSVSRMALGTVAGGAAVAAGSQAIAKGAMNMMMWAKIKLTAVCFAVAVTAGVVSTPLVMLAMAEEGAKPPAGRVYVVAKTGNDSNPGTEAQPWLTVQKAAQTAAAGDTVQVKNGTYCERIVFKNSGTADQYIVFKAYPEHTPELNGKDKAQWDGFINFAGVDYIKFEGFTVSTCPKGQALYIINNGEDPATYIELRNLKIDNVADSAVQVRGNAHHILVAGCTIHDCGASCIDVSHFKGGRPHHATLTGNTCYKSKFSGIGSEVADDLLVEDNNCHDNPIGIDLGSGKRNIIRKNTIRGGENGICLSSNEDSEVCENSVRDVKEALFAYYWSANGQPHARNKWHHNVISNATWALYEMNNKMTKKATDGPTSGHEYFNNVFYNIGTSEYRAPFWFRGVKNFKFYNNTIFMKPGAAKVFELLEGAEGADFRGNIVAVEGNCSLFDVKAGSKAILDQNCYWNRKGSIAAVSPQDRVADPRFVNAEAGDLHLQPDSPCQDAGAYGKR
jgi:RNA polymerase sigma factor (sigma-70 family)